MWGCWRAQKVYRRVESLTIINDVIVALIHLRMIWLSAAVGTRRVATPKTRRC